MDEPFTYRGRTIDEEQAGFIQELISQHPQASRRQLSKLLCEAWDWRQSNGALSDMVCRSMMLALHRAGHIQLPEKRFSPPNPLAKRRPPATDMLLDESPTEGPLKRVQPLVVRQVRRTGSESLFNSLIERITTWATSSRWASTSSTWSMPGIGRWPAWAGVRRPGTWGRGTGSSAGRRRCGSEPASAGLQHAVLDLAVGSGCPHLASHILGRMARRLSADWEEAYGHPIYYLETFVDRERFAGTCYRAANWVHLGQTTGRGIKDKAQGKDRHIKDVLGYPLRQDFRRKRCDGATHE